VKLSALHPVLEDAGDGAMYLEFACPVHGVGAKREGGEFDDTVRVKIAPVGSSHVWQWNGEKDFEKLTLTPSINAVGHWHGFITNGEVTTV
jgi:hypothetical protein